MTLLFKGDMCSPNFIAIHPDISLKTKTVNLMVALDVKIPHWLRRNVDAAGGAK